MEEQNKAPLVEALKNAIKNPTYQFHIPGHTKGVGVFPEFKNLIGRQTFMLKKIDYCLNKIKAGTYGVCEECEGDIEINRLKARPVATQCIACKEAEERGEERLLYEKKSHTHGKTMFNNVILMNSYREPENNIVAINSENF
jgi:hypothetical protein